MYSRLKSLYQQHLLLRFTVQAVLVLLIYFSIRYWKSLDDIQGLAPPIDALGIQGQRFNLDDYRGQPVLVHFWATWCKVCAFENSSIASLSLDYPVITVAAWSDGANAVQAYMQKQGLEMPVIVDEGGMISRAYGVRAVPSSFFINAQGQLEFIEKGFTSEIGLRLRMWWMQTSDGRL